jgi:glutamate/tyrosine decarboxylase-like PLP-dependent enzyme
MITPTLAGTRPGGAISAAWAVMNFLGVDGYRAKQGLVTRTRERIQAGVEALGFSVMGRPQLGILSFSHKDGNCMAIWAKLRERGWFASLNTEPLALHLMLSPFHAEVADAYLVDLAWALKEAQVPSASTPTGVRYS